MLNKKGSSDYGVLFVLIIVGFLLIGEVMCMVKFFTSDFEPSYKREAIYGISAVTGLGCLVGWLNIKDTPPKNKSN